MSAQHANIWCMIIWIEEDLGEEGGTGSWVLPPSPFLMNNDIMHTAIYAPKSLPVSVTFVDFQAGV